MIYATVQKMEFLIFEFGRIVSRNNYFIYAEAEILSLFLIEKKVFRVIIKLILKRS